MKALEAEARLNNWAARNLKDRSFRVIVEEHLSDKGVLGGVFHSREHAGSGPDKDGVQSGKISGKLPAKVGESEHCMRDEARSAAGSATGSRPAPAGQLVGKGKIARPFSCLLLGPPGNYF